MFVSHRGWLLNELTRDSIQLDRLLVLNKAGAHCLRKPRYGFVHTDIINIFPDHLGVASGSGTGPPGRGAASDFTSGSPRLGSANCGWVPALRLCFHLPHLFF